MKNNTKIAFVLVIVVAMVSVAAITLYSDNSVAAGGMYYAMDDNQIAIDGDLAIDYNLNVDINAAPGDYSCSITITPNGNYTGTLSIGILDKSTTPWTYTTYASLVLTDAGNVQIVASIETGSIVVAGFEISNINTNAWLAADGTYELKDGVPSGTFGVTQGSVVLGTGADSFFNGTVSAGDLTVTTEFTYGMVLGISDDGTAQISGNVVAGTLADPVPLPTGWDRASDFPTPTLSFSGLASIRLPDAIQQRNDFFGENATNVLTTDGIEVTIADGAVITAGDRAPSVASDVSINGTNIIEGYLFDNTNPNGWFSIGNINGNSDVITFDNVPLGTYVLFMLANTNYVYLTTVTVTATGITLYSNTLPSTLMADDAFTYTAANGLTYDAGAYTFMSIINLSWLEAGTSTVDNGTLTGSITFPEYGFNNKSGDNDYILAVMLNCGTGIQEVYYGQWDSGNQAGGLLKVSTATTLATPDLIRGSDVSICSAISTFTVVGADTVHIYGTLNLLYRSADQYGAFNIVNNAFVNLEADGGEIVQGVKPPADGSLTENPVSLIFGSYNLVTAYYFTNDTTGIPATATYTLTSLSNAIKESNQVTLYGSIVVLEDLMLSSPNSDPLKVIIGPNSSLQIGRAGIDQDNPAISVILTIPSGTTLTNPNGQRYEVVNGQVEYDVKPSVYDSPTVAVIMTDNNRFIYTDLATALEISTGNDTIDTLRPAILLRNETVQSGVIINDTWGITIPDMFMLIVNGTVICTSGMTIDGTLQLNSIVNFYGSTVTLNGSIVVASNGTLNLNGSNLTGGADSVLVVDGTLNMTAASSANVNTLYIEGKATTTDLIVNGVLRIGAVPSSSDGYTNGATITGKLTLGNAAVAWVYGGFNGRSVLTNVNVNSTQYMIDTTLYLTIFVDGINTTQCLPMIYGDEFGAYGYMLGIVINDWNNNRMLRGDSLIGNGPYSATPAFVGAANWATVYADWSAKQFKVSFNYTPGVTWTCNGETIGGINNLVTLDYGTSISVQASVQPGYEGTPVILKNGMPVSGNPYATTVTGNLIFSAQGVQGSGVYIPISTPEDLAKIGNDPSYPLDGNYYLTNDIKFTPADETNGGSDVQISVMISGTDLIITLTPLSGGSVTSLYAWFGAFYANSSGNTVTLSGIPSGTNTLSVGGTLSTGDNFAYSMAIDTTKNSASAMFNSNGNFTSIGTGSLPFTGTFDGKGYVISGMDVAVYSPDSDVSAGLFRFASGSISNLGVVNGSVTAIASSLNGANAGGIAGGADSMSISNCFNTCPITASSINGANAGGIAGYESLSVISDCYNTGTITASSPSPLWLPDQIEGACAGGIVGQVDPSESTELIFNCYNSGSVTALSLYGLVGGIAGWALSSSLTISDCFNTGPVTASLSDTTPMSTSYAGGIVGQISLFEPTASITISNCYNTGLVTVPWNAYAGNIVGYATSTTISNCYYLSDNINRNGIMSYGVICGGGDYAFRDGDAINHPSGVYSAEQMAPALGDARNGNSIYFVGSGGWDFSYGGVWTIVEGENNGHPILDSLGYVGPDKPPSYDVILTPGTGYTLTPVNGSSSPVANGGSFLFKMTVDPAYAVNAVANVMVNGDVLEPVSGVYTINNITENQTVTVSFDPMISSSSALSGGTSVEISGTVDPSAGASFVKIYITFSGGLTIAMASNLGPTGYFYTSYSGSFQPVSYMVTAYDGIPSAVGSNMVAWSDTNTI